MRTRIHLIGGDTLETEVGVDEIRRYLRQCASDQDYADLALVDERAVLVSPSAVSYLEATKAPDVEHYRIAEVL